MRLGGRSRLDHEEPYNSLLKEWKGATNSMHFKSHALGQHGDALEEARQ